MRTNKIVVAASLLAVVVSLTVALFDSESTNLYAAGLTSNNSSSNNSTFIPLYMLTFLKSGSGGSNKASTGARLLSEWDGNGAYFEENGDRFTVTGGYASAPGLGVEGDRALYCGASGATISLDSAPSMTFKGIRAREAQGVRGEATVILRDSAGAEKGRVKVELGPDWSDILVEGVSHGVSSVQIETDGNAVLIDAMEYDL